MKLLTMLLLEDGQGLTEYALILVAAIIAAVAALTAVGSNLHSFYYDRFNNEMNLYLR